MNRPYSDHGDDVPATLRLLVLGATAGLAASAAVSLFQAGWARARLPPTVHPPAEPPPTEVLADNLASAARGSELSGPEKASAGRLVHYVVGAGLGAVYVLAARARAEAAAGRGLAYGLAVWASLEEMGLALFRLKSPPWRVEPAEHGFAAASHIVFGLALDAVLALLLGRPVHTLSQERRR